MWSVFLSVGISVLCRVASGSPRVETGATKPNVLILFADVGQSHFQLQLFNLRFTFLHFILISCTFDLVPCPLHGVQRLNSVIRLHVASRVTMHVTASLQRMCIHLKSVGCIVSHTHSFNPQFRATLFSWNRSVLDFLIIFVSLIVTFNFESEYELYYL